MIIQASEFNKISNNSLISQIYIADHLKQFKYDILTSYPFLKLYNNHQQPCIFYGIVSENDLKHLECNEALKVIVWTGGDIYVNDKKKRVFVNIERIQKLKNVVHIAISKFIESDLTVLKIPYIKIPFMGIQLKNYKPVVKGSCIYVYTCPLNERKYGKKYYNKLVQKYKNINFIFTCNQYFHNIMKVNNVKNPLNISYYDKEHLIKYIYPQCFLNLRLTEHDGLAGSVQELGVLGIKSIHNGDSPSCLNYTNFNDICAHINNEYKTIGTIDVQLSNCVKEYLTIPYFFNTAYYNTNNNLS